MRERWTVKKDVTNVSIGFRRVQSTENLVVKYFCKKLNRYYLLCLVINYLAKTLSAIIDFDF